MAKLTGKYAFMDAVDVKLYPAGTDVTSGAPSVDPEGTITIDYLNSSALSLSVDTQYALIKGANAIPFSGNKSGSFTMDAQAVTMEYLAMVLGGEYLEDGSILVTDTTETPSYVLVGTFRGKQHGNNTTQIFDVILYNVSAQPSVDMTLDATSIGSFPLVLDVLADTNGQIAKIQPHAE